MDRQVTSPGIKNEHNLERMGPDGVGGKPPEHGCRQMCSSGNACKPQQRRLVAISELVLVRQKACHGEKQRERRGNSKPWPFGRSIKAESKAG
jgi:hypothetical protein